MIRVIVESIMWAFLIWLIVSIGEVKADAYKGKEDVKPDGKPSIIYNISRPGRLLPFKTYQTDDRDRPKWWNGYGVDPSGANYWYYFNEETECLEGYREVWEGTNACATINIEEEKIGSIPEPSILLLLAVGYLWNWRLSKS